MVLAYHPNLLISIGIACTLNAALPNILPSQLQGSRFEKQHFFVKAEDSFPQVESHEFASPHKRPCHSKGAIVSSRWAVTRPYKSKRRRKPAITSNPPAKWTPRESFSPTLSPSSTASLSGNSKTNKSSKENLSALLTTVEDVLPSPFSLSIPDQASNPTAEEAVELSSQLPEPGNLQSRSNPEPSADSAPNSPGPPEASGVDQKESTLDTVDPSPSVTYTENTPSSMDQQERAPEASVEIQHSPDPLELVSPDLVPAAPLSTDSEDHADLSSQSLQNISFLPSSPLPVVPEDGENAGIPREAGEGNGHGSSYQELLVGQKVNYTFNSQATIYKGSPLLKQGEYGQKVFKLKNPLPNTATRTNEMAMSSEGLWKRGTRQSLVIIQACTVLKAKRYDSWREYPPTRILVFARDPRLVNPGLIAASTVDSRTKVSEACASNAKVEFSIPANQESFAIVSVSKAVFPAEVSISALCLRKPGPVVGKKYWNVALFGGPTGTPKEISEETATPVVYFLSSVPYLEHSEFSTFKFDETAMNEISSLLKSSKADPFCHSRGTELAAALTGRTLGTVRTALSLIPVPIRSCEVPASSTTILQAFQWVLKHLRRPSQRKTQIILLEDFNLFRLPSKPLLSVMRKVVETGALLFLSSSKCFASNNLSLTIGPYGLRKDGEFRVPEVQSRCAQQFDLFGTGFRVVGASTSGTNGYRNISVSAEVAVANTVGFLLNFLTLQSERVYLANLKGALNEAIGFSRAYVGSKSLVLNLPILNHAGVASLKVSLKNPLLNSSGQSNSRTPKAFPPSLSMSAMIGICLCAGMTAFMLMVGGAFYVRRRQRRDESDFSYMTSEGAGRDNDEESTTKPVESLCAQDIMPSNLHVAEIAAASQMTDSQLEPGDLRDRVGDGKKGTDNYRVAVRRILSLTANKSPDNVPQTPNSKASWFATPRASSRRNRKTTDTS